MNAAANLFNTGESGGFKPYAGETIADINPWQTIGQQASWNMSASEPGGSQYLNNARTFGDQMIAQQGLSPGLVGAANNFQNIYNQASGTENPFLQATLDASNRKIADKVNSATSGAGRYGSAAHTDVLARSMAEAANPMLAQDYQSRQAQRQQAASSLADLYNTGLQTAGKWAQLTPGLDEARFGNAGRMMDLGQFFSNRNQGQLNSDIALYNAQQSFPWENLARYNAIITGAGGLGGTQVTGTSGFTQQPTTMQKLFGGAAAGAGLGGTFGGLPGAGIGAVGGGLLSLLG